VQVWVVDDQASFRLATAATLAVMEGFVMAGECETGESAIELISDGGVGMVLMDIQIQEWVASKPRGESAPHIQI